MGVGAAVIGGAVVGVAGSAYAANKGASASRRASRAQSEAQGDSLDYLKEVERLPRALREEALMGLGAEVGYTFDNEGNIVSDGTTMQERALASPMYTGAREQGAEAIMRRASATGGLRSGNTQDALYRADSALYQNAYQQQQNLMAGLSGLPSHASDIAGVITGIGQTQAAGIMGAGQAQQAGIQGIGNAISGGINNYLQYGGGQQTPYIGNSGYGTSGGYGASGVNPVSRIGYV